MLVINTLPFLSLRNAEHVSFINNVILAIEKIGAEDLGLNAAQFAQFKKLADEEQDIVLKAQGSMYTADMEAADAERDRLFRIIRHKLQAVALVSDQSPLASLKVALEKYILNKYSSDIVSLAYQEESAHLSGFDLDMRDRFTDDELEVMGIANDLTQLKATNDRFSEMYNERANERSGGTAEESKRLRAATEDQYAHVKLYLEFTADTAGDTDKGVLCANLIGIINELVRDARYHLNKRLGKEDAGSSDVLDESVSPIPFPQS